MTTAQDAPAQAAVEEAVHAAMEAPQNGPLTLDPDPEAAAEAASKAIVAKITPMVEAMIVSSPRAASLARLAQALGLEAPPAEVAATAPAPEPAVEDSAAPKRGRRKPKTGPTGRDLVQRAIEALNATYAETGRSFRIEPLVGGYRLMTLPDHAAAIAAFHGAASQSKLSRAAVETLAIIAYRQPVTRATLEAIRGVACGEVVRTLLERKLIAIAGRAEELGRPMLYATSKQFLDAFGLASNKDLPALSDLGLATPAAEARERA